MRLYFLLSLICICSPSNSRNLKLYLNYGSNGKKYTAKLSQLILVLQTISTNSISNIHSPQILLQICLLYTSDAADDTPCVDLGGRRIIKKKNNELRHYTICISYQQDET
eukprot:TRINITY_DN9703_c0_g1_i3.p1 TRINITY_DN9703_c0_g1~~TRINITY_DN9703_c0_g1_i3.p1  ORF type:complete len:110 (-),score=4.97 TRINITY_DN9703_c0_g1_i3:31-360(-)